MSEESFDVLPFCRYDSGPYWSRTPSLKRGNVCAKFWVLLGIASAWNEHPATATFPIFMRWTCFFPVFAYRVPEPRFVAETLRVVEG